MRPPMPTKMIVVLDDDPYSPKALKTIEQINDTVSNALNGTVLSSAKVGVSGPVLRHTI